MGKKLVRHILGLSGGKDSTALAVFMRQQFSAQRKWLIDAYTENDKIDVREEFIRRMANTATYCSKLIYYSNRKNIHNALSEIEDVSESDRKRAILCLLYLQDAGHKMANTIISRFYALVIRNEPNSNIEFVFASKVVAAFFTMWRSALPNSGLDDVYRDLLRDKMSWKKGNSELTVENLKEYFRNKLNDKGIGTKDDWKRKAIQYLRYDNAKHVCRFALFVTAHDTILDPNVPGLMKIGISSSSPYLEPSKWDDEDFKNIEHIAPKSQTFNSLWDNALYKNEDYEQIGNLTLLPREINRSAGNKGWIEKWIYYRHLAETDPNKLKVLKKEAENNGVNLQAETIKLLQNTSHKHHIVPIVQLGASGKWDKAFVEKRTERICDILWERMNEWLT